MNSKRFLNTIAASAYLAEREVMRSPKTLVKLRHTGAGPAFRRVARHVVYEPAALDAWAASIISPPLHSTAQQTIAA
jgi:hypothetical protein